MSQIAQTVSELKKDPGKLSLQTVPNPRGNISTLAVVDVDAALKESAEAVNRLLALNEHIKANNTEKEPESVSIAPTEDISSTLMSKADAPIMSKLGAAISSAVDATHTDTCSKNDPLPSFFMQVRAPKEHMIDKNDLGIELEARDELEEPIMDRPLATSHEAPPGKCKDPGAFIVTCGVGETLIHHCLIDLGAAINDMPYSLYCSLRLGPLKPPKLLVELGDKSLIRPIGLLEDLTLRVGDLFVPAYFYVLQMGDARDDDPPTLILGRPFLFATKTKIDMDKSLLSLAFGGKTSDFHIYEDVDRPCMKKPPDIIHTPFLGAIAPYLLDEARLSTRCAANEVAMIEVPSQTKEDVKANPPDRWKRDMREPFFEVYE
ncbi:unnamed protein product [Rhodiola kirilowii]